jgi:hypothetical protein
VAQEGTCTLGRIGVTAANGGDGLLVLKEPHDITVTGDGAMSIAGTHVSSTANIQELMWVRDMVTALADRGGEPVIPCTFSSFEHLDGYYRVTGAGADRTPGATTWHVDLERIQDYRNPKVEIHTLCGIVTNSHGATTGNIWVGNPGGTASYYHGFGLGLASTTVSNGDGPFTQTTWSASESQAALAGFVPFVQHLYVPAANWYKGGCRIEYDVQFDPFSSPGYLGVVGRRAFPSTDIAGRIRMSNGLVRVLPDTVGSVDTYWWDGAAWDGPYRWDALHSATTLNFASGSILRNTPEECAIRLASNVPGDTLGPVYLDLSIRRGSRNVIGYLIGAGYQSNFQFSVTPNPTYAATSITGGVRRTANDANGNRTFLVSNNGTTISTANGSVAQASAGSLFLFAIGNEVGGSGATGLNVAAEQAAQFWMGTSESGIVTAL